MGRVIAKYSRPKCYRHWVCLPFAIFKFPVHLAPFPRWIFQPNNSPISRRSLEIQFQHYLGRSPAEEIRRVRLEKGKELLARSDFSIGEIAVACGFANTTRFGVAFRKRYGQTPLAYRKQLARSNE